MAPRARCAAWPVLMSALLSVGGVNADDRQAAKHLGRGLQAFHTGQYFEAVRDLDEAASVDPRDARIYFFRGLAKWRTGDRLAAEADFQMGAQLEVALARIDVGRALQRIQGPERLELERFRREARQLTRDEARKLIPPAPGVVSMPQRAPAGRPPRLPVPTNLAESSDDPFREDSPGFLGRGDLTPSTTAEPSDTASGLEATGGGRAFDDDPIADDTDFAGDDPVGTGVADPDAPSDANIDDPFGDPRADTPASPPAGGRSATAPKKSGAFGAALRALGRGLTPNLPTPPNVPQILGGGNAPPNGAPDSDEMMDDGFGAGGNDADADVPEDDPFGDPFQDEP